MVKCLAVQEPVTECFYTAINKDESQALIFFSQRSGAHTELDFSVIRIPLLFSSVFLIVIFTSACT